MPIATVLDEKPKVDDKPLIESSTFRSYKAYVDAGFEKDTPRAITAQLERENKFLSQVQLDKGPLTRRISKIVRRKENYTEYITFQDNWTGTDWVGRPIDPVTDNKQGVLQLPNVTPTINEKGQRIGKDLNGSIFKYEIPFSKEAVDKIIEETGTPKEEIEFVIRTSERRQKCNYEQFLYPWNQAIDVLLKDGAFESDYIENQKKKQKP